MSELLTVEHAWSRLATHLEWADRFWVGFVFTDDPQAVELLRQRAQERVEAGSHSFALLQPKTPAEVEHVIATLLEGSAADVNFVDLVRHDDHTNAPGWAHAWERLMVRLNERRELLRRRFPTGGIVFATTLNRLDDTPGLAPDLWTIRGLLLRVARGAAELAGAESSARSSVERRPELWQAVEQARGRADPYELLEALVVLAAALESREALAIARDARTLAEQLLAGEGVPRDEELAAALRRLGDVLARAEFDTDAEACYRRAIDIGYVPEVAAAQLGLGGVFAHMAGFSRTHAVELRERALDVTREAVASYRELAKEQKATYLPALANSLSAYGSRLGALRRTEAALAVLEEAFEIQRELVVDQRESHLAEFAKTAEALAHYQLRISRWEGGLERAREAVSAWRELVRCEPEAYLDRLAPALANLGSCLSHANAYEGALEVNQECVDLYRKLAVEGSARIRSELAAALGNMASVLSAMNRGEEALGTAQEGVEIRRVLTAEHPDVFAPYFADSLGRLGAVYSDLGRYAEAGGCFAEGLRAILPAFTQQSSAYRRSVVALAENLRHIQDRYGIEVPDDLASVVTQLLDPEQERPPGWDADHDEPGWQPISVYENPAPQSKEPASVPQPVARIEQEPPSTYVVRAVILIAVIAAVLVLASLCS